MKAIITQGISTSGKSTLAAQKVEEGYTEINRDFIRFNIVKPGTDWRTYKFSKQNEKEVTDIHGKMIMDAWGRMENIIISDTNLNQEHLDKLVKHLEDLGYEVEIHQIHITLEEAWKRDAYRLNGVGHNVLYNQWLKWQGVIGRPVYKSNYSLPAAIIVDVDGTIAEMGDRGPFDWKRVGEDTPRLFILDMVMNYHQQGYEILIVSGRSDECEQETLDWLDKHDVPFAELHMRKSGDFRKDNAVKEEIFWTHLADRYNIVAAIDDRPQMIRLWHDIKIPNVIAVANPYIEF